jgi:molecular chaperone GrpE
MADKEKKKKEEKEKEPENETSSSSEMPAQDEAEMVTIPLTDYAEQLEKLDELQTQLDQFSDGWQRERAEFANYRKQSARNEEFHRQTSRIDILRKYLDIHDDIDLAVKNMPEHIKDDPWSNGILLIQQKLNSVLKSEGLEPITSEDNEFNPNIHEAISLEENPDVESGKIIETVQQGYRIGDRVVRPSRVRVAK